MKFYSPSYKRAHGILTHQIIPNVIYCVHQFEADEYRAKRVNVIEIPDTEKGNIARVRNWIKKTAENKGGRFCIIDDDIKAFTYWSKGKQHKLSDDRLIEHIEAMFDLAESWGVKFFGVNPAIDKGSFKEYTPFSLSSYISGSFNGFVNCPAYFDENLPLKEDYDFTLQILNQFRKVLRFNAYGLSKNDHANLGGCANYRTYTKEKEQMDLLQKKWGSKIVKIDQSSVKKFDINPIIKAPIKGV
jgi:hypothetical protein